MNALVDTSLYMNQLAIFYGNLTKIVLSVQLDKLGQLNKIFRENSNVSIQLTTSQ